jgi:lipid II:glycine glycyltransferase (peptidoglycan interpeptide bridge formation enzyme)
MEITMTLECNENEYQVETGAFPQSKWEDVIRLFDDATLYQTCSYGQVRWGRQSLDHLVLRQGGDIVAAAQVRLICVPVLGPRIAYIAWGPMWRRKGHPRKPEIFRQVLHALSEEYAKKRRMYLRIVPNAIAADNSDLTAILDEEGYQFQKHVQPYRSFIVDIQPDLEEIRKHTLHKKWREKLSRSLRNNLDVRVGTDDEMYEVFENLYYQMHSRKGFVRFVSIDEFRAANRLLADDLKLKIGMCYREGRAIATLIWSDIGEKGISILSATGHEGLNLRGAYLLRWKMFEGLKQNGCRFSDQGGLDPINNPGGYEFRQGLGGMDICHLGQYDRCTRPFLAVVFQGLDWMRAMIRLTKLMVNRFRKKILSAKEELPDEAKPVNPQSSQSGQDTLS